MALSGCSDTLGASLAYQLAGTEGLRLIHAEGKDEERETPPAEPLVVELLSEPQEEGLSTLVLLDEVLMYLRGQVEVRPASRGGLVNFFQYLTQAVVKVDQLRNGRIAPGVRPEEARRLWQPDLPGSVGGVRAANGGRRQSRQQGWMCRKSSDAASSSQTRFATPAPFGLT